MNEFEYQQELKALEGKLESLQKSLSELATGCAVDFVYEARKGLDIEILKTEENIRYLKGSFSLATEINQLVDDFNKTPAFMQIESGAICYQQKCAVEQRRKQLDDSHAEALKQANTGVRPV